MNVKRFEFLNCLGIKELKYNAGKVNVISGGNEKGKTSILECLEKTLNNTQRRAKFIKTGEDESRLYVELDNGINIERKLKPDGYTSIKVTQNGDPIKKPETVLKNLINVFSFNPIDFMGKKGKEQTEILLNLIPMHVSEKDLLEWFGEVPPVNLNQHAIKVLEYLAEKWYYDKRAIANGEVKECQNEIVALREQLPDNYNADEWRSVKVGELYNKVSEAEKVNQLINLANDIISGHENTVANINNKYDLKIKDAEELLEFKIEKAKKSVEVDKQVIQNDIIAKKDLIENLKAQIKQLENDIVLLNDKLKGIDNNVLNVKIESLTNEKDIEVKNIEANREIEVQKAEKKLNDAKTYAETHKEIDTTELQQNAENAETMKGYIQMADNLADNEELLQQKQANASRLDGFVKYARKLPAELLKKIKLPVEGLGINDEMQITIDDLPIDNLSTSRQLRLALDIAKATCGPLKMICIDRFESLDEDQRQLLLDIAENDTEYQYFITLVTKGDMKIEKVGA